MYSTAYTYLNRGQGSGGPALPSEESYRRIDGVGQYPARWKDRDAPCRRARDRVSWEAGGAVLSVLFDTGVYRATYAHILHANH